MKMKVKNGLLRIAAQCWIAHETLKRCYKISYCIVIIAILIGQ